MTDPVIPPEAVEAVASSIFGPDWDEVGEVLQDFWRGRSRTALTAALPHLRPLVEAPACNCYPGGFSPETYEGPQHRCAVHGHGNDLPTSECPVCLGERSVIATATKLGRQLGRQEALAEMAAEMALSEPWQWTDTRFRYVDVQIDKESWRQIMAARDTGKGESL